MKVLVVGAGGREHAICWALNTSPLIEKLYCAPGNAGIADEVECINIHPENLKEIRSFCIKSDINFVVVGPEQPLCAGIVDMLERAGIAAFGPKANAALLEGSKAFTKNLCTRYGIPTAKYREFTNESVAIKYIETLDFPVVVKADGLAAGKGAIICNNKKESISAARSFLDQKSGNSNSKIVIEDFLVGEEVSFFALCDGKNLLPLATAQDHKRVGDGDTGPNTGGMGAYSPAPIMDHELCKRTMDEIIIPTVKAMSAEGRQYKGVLYAGLMITNEGPKLIEYNARFGDPECQVLMTRLDSDITEALIACSTGTLNKVKLRWRKEAALIVVMATKGYPGKYKSGSSIVGLEALHEIEHVKVFHAATRKEEGRIVANGGRVLGITALGNNISDAHFRAYQGVNSINWPDGFCRQDIGWRALAREQKN